MQTITRAMQRVPKDQWPVFTNLESEALDLWRLRDYMAVLYRQRLDGNVRLTVNSVRKGPNGRWRDGITWDELQRVKNECLGEDVWCVEVYPAQDMLVNDDNQRHLWVLDGPPETRFTERSVYGDDEIRAAVDLLRSMLPRRDGGR